MPAVHPVRITIGAAGPGPVVPGDFAGLSFERGPLNPDHAGVPGYLFGPGNDSLAMLFRETGLRSLRVGGGTVDQLIPAGTGGDGFAGIDSLFAFAATAGVRVIYTLRLLSPAANPVAGLPAVNARVAGYIWERHREHLAAFAIGNEPDWHAFHTYPGHPFDPAIREAAPGVPGSAYPSYLARWREMADAVRAVAPQARVSGPDTGAYTTLTYSPDPDSGVSWGERLALDERASGRLSEITQHHYVGGDPGETTAGQAIGNMLSREWAEDTEIGSQPAGTRYVPNRWIYENNLAPVVEAGLPYRFTEANDYLGGVRGASDAFASALWALDHLHWWAARGAAGVSFHNKQWLCTGTIVPADPGDPGRGYAVNPKAYGIRAFVLGSAGRTRPVRIDNPGGLNLTAYCVGDSVTIINKTHGADAADAAVTIAPAGHGVRRARVMTLAGGQPGEAGGQAATLGGAAITGDARWRGTWQDLPADPQDDARVTVAAATAAVVRLGLA